MADPIMDRFSDLREDYPGKREPVNRKTDDDDDKADSWDDTPVTYLVGGEEREFFTISNLAAALNRSPVTIRSWENRGVLPRTPYRSPRPRRETVPGREPKGKRLWTREQILGILKIAEEEQVILNGEPPNERFYKRVLALFQALLDQS